jgi:hypothetical protein
VYVPPDLQEIVNEAYQQREIDTMQLVAPMAKEFGEEIVEIAKKSGLSIFRKEDLGGLVRNDLNNEQLIKLAIRRCYGNSESPQTFIPDAVNRVTSDWFAFQNARVTLTLIAVFLTKYGLTDQPGTKFPNTKLDLEYLSLLRYADALASDETSGDMADMCEWLYGSTKKRISSAALLRSVPRTENIRLSAFWKWAATGKTHGHDIADWLASESELYEAMWGRL